MKVADLKGAIALLQETLDEELKELQKDIDLGLLDELAEDKSYVYQNIKCTPVVSNRWTYNAETKKMIKSIQEQAQYKGDAVSKQTHYLKLTIS